MIISTTSNNPLAFALDSKKVDFAFQSKKRLVGMMAVENGRTFPVSVCIHMHQAHVTAHLPQTIPGSSAFLFYEQMAQGEDDVFNFHVDPSDGELQLIVHLCERNVEHLDETIESMAKTINKHWGKICSCAERADSLDGDSKEMYSHRTIRRHLKNEE